MISGLVLVDTSVWIEFFRADSAFDLLAHVSLDQAVTCLPVVQEVLQGFDDPPSYRIARDAMLAMPIVESPLPLSTFEAAVELYRTARHNGLTIRSSVDCLIAACALRHSLSVVHRDRDFDLLAKVSALQAVRV